MSERQVGRVSLDALNNDRIEIVGGPNERLPGAGEVVYISPSTGVVREGAEGDTLRSLPPDSVVVPRATWGLRLWRNRAQSPPPIFSEEWYQGPEVVAQFKQHATEFQAHGFQLYASRSSANPNVYFFWSGKFDGVGEVVVTYRRVGEKLTPSLALPDQEESLANRINSALEKTPGLSPFQSLVFCMGYLAREKVNASESMVRDTSRAA